LRLPLYKPEQGWRLLFDEIVVVVIGVLIALGAQQLVDDWRWRGEVADYRSAVRDELAHNLGAYSRRLEQTRCVTKRLDQLQRWSEEAGDGGPLASPISRPISYSLRSGVWRSQTQDVASHLPLQERLSYAYLYDAFDNYQAQRDSDRDLWAEISEFEGTGPLDRSAAFRLRGLVTRARNLETAINLNWPQIRDRAAGLGIHPVKDPTDTEWLHNLCDPLSWQRS
jgi:hypothetical protein